jgi:phosphoglycolate phosphatase-like HAD superfamily hydrolase
MVRAVVFDLDGTLVDSSGDILESIENSFLRLGLPLEVELTSKWIGPSLSNMLKAIAPQLPNGDLDNVAKCFRELYDRSGFPLTTAYDSVEELLEFLTSRNVPCLIATNKPRYATENLLTKKNLSRFFKGWNCIGDGASDIDAAKKLGMKSIAHLGGYGRRECLLACRPDHAVERMSEIKQILERFFWGENGY